MPTCRHMINWSKIGIKHDLLPESLHSKRVRIGRSCKNIKTNMPCCSVVTVFVYVTSISASKRISFRWSQDLPPIPRPVIKRNDTEDLSAVPTRGRSRSPPYVHLYWSLSLRLAGWEEKLPLKEVNCRWQLGCSLRLEAAKETLKQQRVINGGDKSCAGFYQKQWWADDKTKQDSKT